MKIGAKNKKISVYSVRRRHFYFLTILVFSALILAFRLAYLFCSDAALFPVAAVRVAASYRHVSHQELEAILAPYVNGSFFTFSTKRLQEELSALCWIESARVERVWPDTLKIKLREKVPIAVWNNKLMTARGALFGEDLVTPDLNIPYLKGPSLQKTYVLQVYEKLSKILSLYDLSASGLILRANHAWILTLKNGVKVYLGKKDLDARLERFCKAYPAVFAEKSAQLASVDLRYPRGMAVQWKQESER